MSILDSIQSPRDVKYLTEDELRTLVDEVRAFTVDAVSKTGGHLSSSLGVAEITVAIHRVFDTSRDRLVFDVGHQSYIHKALTGRRDKFDTLRSFGGIAGFPKPSESEHDAFIGGHASAAVSEALGMARARTIAGEDYSVIALLGDGALTGGMAYEALCDAGASREPLIVILNDNGMSIAKNVGGMAKYLTRLRLRRGYRTFKTIYRKVTSAVPGGKWVYRFTHKLKENIKRGVFNCGMFEDWGFSYLGPVDGHDLGEVIRALEVARDLRGPVIIHAITTKGKGYAPAEKNPEAFHGVGAFDKETGLTPSPEESFATRFGEYLTSLAEDDKDICAITAAMAPGTGLSGFGRTYPNRFFDVGIAEEHAAGMAAGLAAGGMKPVLAVYSTFLQRSYDQLIHDIGILSEHVVLAVDKAGLVGEDGETHHGVFDVNYLRSVPKMTVLCPASYAELRDMLSFALYDITGPVAVRYPKGGEGEYRERGVDKSKLLRTGEDFTIITYGININDAVKAADMLAEKSIYCDVLKLGSIKPLDEDAIIASVSKTGRLYVLEECVSGGCVGEEIASMLVKAGQSPRRLVLRNLGDSFVPHGKVQRLREEYGLDAESVAREIEENIPDRIKERKKKEVENAKETT